MISPEAEARAVKLCDAAVSWRDVDGEIVALDIESGAYLTLNGSGRLLWLALVEPSSIEALSELLMSTYGIEADRARSDALAFVDDLTGRNLIESVG